MTTGALVWAPSSYSSTQAAITGEEKRLNGKETSVCTLYYALFSVNIELKYMYTVSQSGDV